MSPPTAFTSFRPRGGFRPNLGRGFQSNRNFRPNSGRGFQSNKNSHPNGSGISFYEQITMKDIQEGNLTNKIVKIVETLSSTLSCDASCIMLKLSANVIKKDTSKPKRSVVLEIDNRDPKEVAEDLEKALEKHLENKQKVLAERSEKLKKIRENKSKPEETVEELENLNNSNSTATTGSKKRKHSGGERKHTNNDTLEYEEDEQQNTTTEETQTSKDGSLKSRKKKQKKMLQ